MGRRAPPDFGIFFDIDGVIVRGKNVLPFAPHAFKRLVDDNGNFKVPTVFVTNACNTLRKNKVSKSLKKLVVFVKPFVLRTCTFLLFKCSVHAVVDSAFRRDSLIFGKI